VSRVPCLPLAAVLLLSGCHHGSASPGPGDAQAEAAGPAVTVDRKAYPKLLNPPGPEGTLFFAGSGEGCHRMKVPHPEQVPDLNASEPAACPDALRDPAWNACAGGAMFGSTDGQKCLCVTGAPTPRATPVGCPAPPEDVPKPAPKPPPVHPGRR
jgi:hypothetical protein